MFLLDFKAYIFFLFPNLITVLSDYYLVSVMFVIGLFLLSSSPVSFTIMVGALGMLLKNHRPSCLFVSGAGVFTVLISPLAWVLQLKDESDI